MPLFYQKVPVVNGYVHAICRASGKPVVIRQFSEHFKACDKCVVFYTLEEFREAQAKIVFTEQLDAFVECGVSCPVCRGKNLDHRWVPLAQRDGPGMIGRRWRRPSTKPSTITPSPRGL